MSHFGYKPKWGGYKSDSVGPYSRLKDALARVAELKAVVPKREFTDAEIAEVEALSEDVKHYRAESEEMDKRNAALKAIAGNVEDGSSDGLGFLNLKAPELARTAAEHLLKSGTAGRKSLVVGGGVVAPVQVDPTPAAAGRPVTGLLQVIPVLPNTSARFAYLRQSSRDLKAAPVAAGGTKPTSTLGMEPVQGELQVVAHLSEPVDHYLLEDFAALEMFVRDEMVYGITRALEYGILNGSGTAPNLSGLLNTTGVLEQAYSTDVLTTARKAITQLEADGLVPSAFVLSPADWEVVELARTDSGTGKLEMIDQPVDRAARRLWGVPVVTSPEVVDGEGVLLSQGAVSLRVDRGLQLRVSENVGQDFETNQVRFRAELRAEVQCSRPSGVVVLATVATP